MAAINLLDDKIIKAKKPDPLKAIRLNDAKGFYLRIEPDGSKRWRLDYTIGGKRKTLSLGVYPDTTIKSARIKASEARELVADGTDPSDLRKADKQIQVQQQEEERRADDGLPVIGSFADITYEWSRIETDKRSSEQTDKIVRWMVKDVFPWIGRRPINEITSPEIKSVIKRIEERGALDIARRVLFNCGRVFKYAKSEGYSNDDPTACLGEFIASRKETHHAAITDPKAVGALLRAIDGYTGSFVTKCAMQLAPLVFVRPGELRMAEWSEINFETAEWNIPAERMKMDVAHLVPLSAQALSILREIHPLTGSGKYVFTGARSDSRPMCENTVNAALRRMDYSHDQMTGHGFRAMARTILDEVLHVRPDYIEHQLAHAVRDANGRAYNRTAHLKERREMMQLWSDYLDALKSGAVVIPFNKAA